MKLPSFNKPKPYLKVFDRKNFEIHSQKLSKIEPGITKDQTFAVLEKRNDKKKL